MTNPWREHTKKVGDEMRAKANGKTVLLSDILSEAKKTYVKPEEAAKKSVDVAVKDIEVGAADLEVGAAGRVKQMELVGVKTKKAHKKGKKSHKKKTHKKGKKSRRKGKRGKRKGTKRR